MTLYVLNKDVNDESYYLVSFGTCSFLCVNFHVNYKEHILRPSLFFSICTPTDNIIIRLSTTNKT